MAGDEQMAIEEEGTYQPKEKQQDEAWRIRAKNIELERSALLPLFSF